MTTENNRINITKETEMLKEELEKQEDIMLSKMGDKIISENNKLIKYTDDIWK